jgi:hypothetical protein
VTRETDPSPVDTDDRKEVNNPMKKRLLLAMLFSLAAVAVAGDPPTNEAPVCYVEGYCGSGGTHPTGGGPCAPHEPVGPIIVDCN